MIEKKYFLLKLIHFIRISFSVVCYWNIMNGLSVMLITFCEDGDRDGLVSKIMGFTHKFSWEIYYPFLLCVVVIYGHGLLMDGNDSDMVLLLQRGLDCTGNGVTFGLLRNRKVIFELTLILCSVLYVSRLTSS